MLEPVSQRRYLLPFKASRLPQQFTDVLVIGGGVAGLRAAIAAADAEDVRELLRQPRGVEGDQVAALVEGFEHSIVVARYIFFRMRAISRAP